MTANNSKQLKRGRRDVDHSDDDLPIDDSDIKGLLLSLSNKMDLLTTTMSDVDKRLNDKMDGMETSLSKMIVEVKLDMDKRLSSLSADVDKRFVDIEASSSRKCEESAAQVSSDVFKRVDELSAIYESRLDKLERSSLDKELIISGVPMESNDNPLGVVGDICQALNCNLNQRDFTAAFRLRKKSDNSNRSVPIVVRVYDNYVKQEFLSCYFKHKNLNLKDIGFHTPARIFVNESLTKSNREIFNLASDAKKANLISKLFTRNGLVHLQRFENDKPIGIFHINDLAQILPPSFGLKSSHTSRINHRWSGFNSHSSSHPTTNQPDAHSSINPCVVARNVANTDVAYVPNTTSALQIGSGVNIPMDQDASTMPPNQPSVSSISS